MSKLRRIQLLLLLAACENPRTSHADGAPPADPVRGLALMEHTSDSLPAYAVSRLRCTSCHLERGTRTGAASLRGVTHRYPTFVARAGAVATIEDRVNYCFTRSLAGNALPVGGRDMADVVAYLGTLSVDNQSSMPGMPSMPSLRGDSARGRSLYAGTCARCHGAEGDGTAVVPPLWGARSYSVGASMARVERAASFIRHNMPLDRPGALSDQQAYDIATFVNSHARPDLPGKERDWPTGGAPADVPYSTTGHPVAHPTPVLPRQRSSSSISRDVTSGVPSPRLIAKDTR